MRRVLVAASALLAAAAIVASAQQPTTPQTVADSSHDPHAVQPERPTVATHAGTVAPGWLEIESGVERDHVAPSAAAYGVPTELKLGLADHVQLSVFVPLTRPASGSLGVGDVGAGIKWRLLDDAPIVGDFAVLPVIKLPSGANADGRGTGTTDVSLLAISSHELGAVALDLNVGYTHRSGDGSLAPRSATMWAISTGGPFTGPFGWVLEAFGYPGTGGPAGAAPTTALLAGPTWLVHAWLELDAGFITPLSGGQPHAIYAGGVYNVGKVWSP